MGSVFKKTVTRPLPPGAEFITRQGVRLARWRDGKGKTRTAPVTTGKDGADRIRDESGTYFARYRDGDGIVVEVSTGCRDKTAAQDVLADLERKAERVRAGLLTPAEARTAEHLTTPIGEHVAAYIGRSRSERGEREVCREKRRRILDTVLGGCEFRHARGPRPGSAGAMAQPPPSRERVGADPEHGSSDPQRLRELVRRAEHRPARLESVQRCAEGGREGRPSTSPPGDDGRRIVAPARRRPPPPLARCHDRTQGQAEGEADAKVRPEVRGQLEALGRERALIYKTLVLTGLRKNELATLTVAQLRLDGPIPYIELDADDEKNREGNSVMIRADLAEDLRRWLAESSPHSRRKPADGASRFRPGFPAIVRVFDVPDGLVRIFDRDLKLAGIPKRDERGRTLDVHALRTTFGTLLSKGGVPLRTAQAAMRHSDPSLTANVYTDPKLLDVHGALDALPSLPLDAGRDSTPSEPEPSRRGLSTDPSLHRLLH